MLPRNIYWNDITVNVQSYFKNLINECNSIGLIDKYNSTIDYMEKNLRKDPDSNTYVRTNDSMIGFIAKETMIIEGANGTSIFDPNSKQNIIGQTVNVGDILLETKEGDFRKIDREVFTGKNNSIIGATVTVTVDRPLGSYHPEYKDMYYPINYGYIEGVMAPDGEEQDAYILGVNEPVKKFTGKIIAIVRRKDDIEEKWVVVPDGVTFSKEEIRRQIHFQEQYFDSEIVM